MTNAPLPETTGRAPSLLFVKSRIFRLAAIAALASFAVGLCWSQGLWAGLWSDRSLEQLLLDCQSKDDRVRIDAILELGRHPEYLPKSLEGIYPALMQSDEVIRFAAENAVRALGKNLVPDLQPLLTAVDSKKYTEGCVYLTILGLEGREYIPALIQRLDSDSFPDLMSTLFALGAMGQEAAPAYDKLVKLLDVPDKQFNIQVRVCHVFGNLGDIAKPAIPRLMKLADEGVPSARTAAYVTLGMLGPSPDHDIVGLLMKRLDSFYLLDKERALIGLGYLGANAKPALEKIEGLLRDPGKSCQAEAAYAYWKISGESEKPLRTLDQCLDSYDFRLTAVERAGDMGAVSVSLLPKMLKFLDEADEFALHEAVILACGRMGPAAEDAIPRLQAVLGSEQDYQLRETARKALQAIKAKGEK
jgi:HEAT repeat protein